jgi:formylglycine-generating enzyme required for sulfatase activity
MVWVPGGAFLMGSRDFYREERPVHRAAVDGFWMDEHAVTNAEFRRFVKATGHVTVAERPADPSDYPGALPEMLVPSSMVFRQREHAPDRLVGDHAAQRGKIEKHHPVQRFGQTAYYLGGQHGRAPLSSFSPMGHSPIPPPSSSHD